MTSTTHDILDLAAQILEAHELYLLAIDVQTTKDEIPNVPVTPPVRLED